MRLVYVVTRRRTPPAAHAHDIAIAQHWCSVVSRASRHLAGGVSPVCLGTMNAYLDRRAEARLLAACDGVVLATGWSFDEAAAKVAKAAEAMGKPVLDVDTFGWCALEDEEDHVNADEALHDWLVGVVSYVQPRGRA